jgi:hypothetical protein
MTTPTAAAMRAAKAAKREVGHHSGGYLLGSPADARQLSELIDRETGLPELIDFVRECHANTECVCKLNAICGTDVTCTHCQAETLLAKAETR